ncbi:MAG: hypothetical protein ACLSAH_15000 [Bilophila wadsworthia]
MKTSADVRGVRLPGFFVLCLLLFSLSGQRRPLSFSLEGKGCGQPLSFRFRHGAADPAHPVCRRFPRRASSLPFLRTHAGRRRGPAGHRSRRLSARTRAHPDAGGADEFSPDTELPDPAKTGDASPEAVRAVYDALHVDCGMLSAGAAAWFGASRPRNFFEVGDTPVTKRFHVGGCPWR